MNYAKLRSDIEHAINANSAENGSNTPDFILAEFLVGVLRVFDSATAQRDKWYGIAPAPGCSDERRPTQEGA